MNQEQRMRKWIREHRHDHRVLDWLEKHPPPPEWESTDLEYAYLEMADPDTLIGRLLLWFGV